MDKVEGLHGNWSDAVLNGVIKMAYEVHIVLET